jgi:hypothetical protein
MKLEKYASKKGSEVVWSSGRAGKSAGTSTPEDRLSVSGSGTQPSSNLSSSSKYNNRQMSLIVALPNDYASRYGTKTWWKIRYRTTSTSVTDRTTWSATIIGDPVHLVK